MSFTKVGLAMLSVLLAGTPRLLRCAEWYVDGSVPESGDGKTWGTAFKKIQEGIDAASEGDAVIVAQGTYMPIWFKGKNIAVRSTDPLDPGVVASTVIDAGGYGAVAFSGTEGESCVLSGFTIQNASGSDGAISGRHWGGVARATIENNVIRDNTSLGVAFCDGIIQNNIIKDNTWAGVAYCNGIIRNNTISRNSGAGLYQCNAIIQGNVVSFSYSGGGVSECIGTIENNVITDNRADCAGGGLSNSDGIIRNNAIVGNRAPIGGGLWLCGGIIEGNIICGNQASGGCRINTKERAQGGGLAWCAGRIRNNIVFGNRADYYGGGLYDCDAILENNTICFNQAQEGGGLHGCQAEIRNCIIWGNKAFSALYGPQLYLSDQPTYSCIQDWTGAGEGNIAEDPQFVDPDGPDNKLWTYEDNDFRLLPGSPCIDAGRNEDWMWTAVDLSGNHRVLYSGHSFTVDLGAYEYFIPELKLGPSPNEATFTWSSLADKAYSILYTDDLLTWHLAIANFPSSGNQTTSWVDDGSLSGLPPSLVPRRFYRTLENP